MSAAGFMSMLELVHFWTLSIDTVSSTMLADAGNVNEVFQVSEGFGERFGKY